MNDNALSAVVKHLGVTRDDVIIPHRGEPYVDNTTKMTHLRFRRPGDDGEYHVEFKVEYTPKYRPPGEV